MRVMTQKRKGRDRMEETLGFGVPESILATGLVEILTFYPYCTRCITKFHGYESIKRRDRAMFGYPVCFRDSKGETCYEHAEADAIPLPRGKSLLFATVAL